MDGFDVVSAPRPLMSFAKEFSTWDLRLSRDRLRSDSQSQATLVYVLRRYCILMAPFAPFMAERIYQNLSTPLDSIHLELWPELIPSQVDTDLEKQMIIVQGIVEKGHAARKLANIRLRQPLASATISVNLSPDLQQIILDELNLKSLLVGPAFSLDTHLTKELEEEGTARDLMRDIQGSRKKLGLSPSDQVNVELPAWPKSWETEIKKKVGAKSLFVGPVLLVTKI